MPHPELRIHESQSKIQLLVDNDQTVGLPPAQLHETERHTLSHANGIALVAEKGRLDSTNDTHVATEPAHFTPGEPFPHLDITGNTRLGFRIRIPVAAFEGGNMAILTRRNGEPIRRQITGFGQISEELPYVVLGPQDSPIDDPDGVLETSIHEYRTSLQRLQGEQEDRTVPFDYLVGEDHAENGAKAIEKWEVLVCRDNGDGEVRQLKPEHLFRFGVHF